jgi:hypothetical protein
MDELLKCIGEEVTVTLMGNEPGGKGTLDKVDDVGIVLTIPVTLGAGDKVIVLREERVFFPWDNIARVTFSDVALDTTTP